MIFRIFGHSNVLATHTTTIEFTKDSHLTRKGDCILGVRADFDIRQVRLFAKNNRKAKIKISVGLIQDEFTTELNADFNSDHEMVLRKTEFLSERTFGINATKAASEVNRDLVERLKYPETQAVVEIKGV